MRRLPGNFNGLEYLKRRKAQRDDKALGGVGCHPRRHRMAHEKRDRAPALARADGGEIRRQRRKRNRERALRRRRLRCHQARRLLNADVQRSRAHFITQSRRQYRAVSCGDDSAADAERHRKCHRLQKLAQAAVNGANGYRMPGTGRRACRNALLRRADGADINRRIQRRSGIQNKVGNVLLPVARHDDAERRRAAGDGIHADVVQVRIPAVVGRMRQIARVQVDKQRRVRAARRGVGMMNGDRPARGVNVVAVKVAHESREQLRAHVRRDGQTGVKVKLARVLRVAEVVAAEVRRRADNLYGIVLRVCYHREVLLRNAVPGNAPDRGDDDVAVVAGQADQALVCARHAEGYPRRRPAPQGVGQLRGEDDGLRLRRALAARALQAAQGNNVVADKVSKRMAAHAVYVGYRYRYRRRRAPESQPADSRHRRLLQNVVKPFGKYQARVVNRAARNAGCYLNIARARGDGDAD